MNQIPQNIFPHRVDDLSFFSALKGSLLRASAVAELLKKVAHETPALVDVDVCGAADAIHNDILDAWNLVFHYQEELQGIGAPPEASSSVDQ
jgi:hypothetical protein